MVRKSSGFTAHTERSFPGSSRNTTSNFIPLPRPPTEPSLRSPSIKTRPTRTETETSPRGSRAQITSLRPRLRRAAIKPDEAVERGWTLLTPTSPGFCTGYVLGVLSPSSYKDEEDDTVPLLDKMEVIQGDDDLVDHQYHDNPPLPALASCLHVK